MQNNDILTNNGINTLLNETETNIEKNIDMYFQLVEYKTLSIKHNLYLCKLKDNTDIYDRFILKTSKELIINDIIHIKKIIITVSNDKKNISCLQYEHIKYNEYLNKLNKKKKIQEKKEQEKKQQEETNKKRMEEEQRRIKIQEELRLKKQEEELRKKQHEEELKKKKIEDELKRKKFEEELKQKRIEVEKRIKQEEEIKKKKMEEERKRKLEEEGKKKKEEEEINKLRKEEELKKKKIDEEMEKDQMEEELRIKQKEEQKIALLNEELNKETKLALTNLKHESRIQRYNFKWEKGNLKWIDLSGKIADMLSQDEEKKSLDFDFSSDNGEVNDKEINEVINTKELKEAKPVLNNKEGEKIILDQDENEDKKEIEEIFKGIDVKELFKINKKKPNQSKKLQQEFELIINISPKNYKKPIYVKCIKKVLLTDKKNKKYLYYIFRDSDGGEINAFTYSDYNINILDKQIQLNGVYIISKYRIYHLYYTLQINGNYRLVLDSRTKIEPMPPDSVFNNIHFHFLLIEDLFFFKNGCVVDICGIIYDEGEPRYYNMKTGQKFMRNILIADTSMKKMVITLYEPHSKDTRLKVEKGEILAIKYGIIGVTATKIKKLNTSNYTILQNSTGDYKQDMLLREFYEKNPNDDNFLFIFRQEDYKYLKDIRAIMEYNVEHNISQCKISFVTKAYVENFCLDKDSIYKGCPLCSKKLIETNDSKYECIPCKKTYTKPKYIFKLNIRVRDADSNAYFTLLGIKANKILETEPELVKKYLDEGNHQELEMLENKILFNEYIFTVTLTSFVNDKTGKILHNININDMDKAHGENLKRIIQLIHDDEESSP